MINFVWGISIVLNEASNCNNIRHCRSINMIYLVFHRLCHCQLQAIDTFEVIKSNFWSVAFGLKPTYFINYCCLNLRTEISAKLVLVLAKISLTFLSYLRCQLNNLFALAYLYKRVVKCRLQTLLIQT